MRGSGTATLTFSYKLVVDDLDPEGVSVPTSEIGGSNGTVRYASDSLRAPGRVSLSKQDGHKVDGVRATMVSATGKTGETTLTTIWDKALDESSVPPTIRPRSFRLWDTAADTDRSDDITNIAVSGKEVALTLDTPLTASDQLNASYSKSASSPAFRDSLPVRDTVGNWAANSSALVVIRPENEAPAFSEGESATRVIVEGTAAAMDIGSPVTAIDPDADPLTYSLGGTDASSFDFLTSSGQLRTKAALDADSKKIYTVTISVHDGKDPEKNPDTTIDDTTTVTITVTSTDATLSDITLSAGWLDPTLFRQNDRIFHVRRVHSHADHRHTKRRTTVAPRSLFLDSGNDPLVDADSSTNEHEVDLNVGLNVLRSRWLRRAPQLRRSTR